jgi:uncharacterized lipoprotein YddW (UPF0748 family)
MNAYYAFYYLFSLLYFVFVGQSQTVYSQPKHEFRGVWVATVLNIDWPSKKGLSPEQQRQEFKNLVQTHKKLGLNALVVQIRPSSDAFYDSPFEPWSEWLTGSMGKAPSPYYDPLEFMINEAHENGLEFHAWINPFRAIVNVKTQSITQQHITRQRPDWIVPYGSKRLINPGIPQARDYIIRVVMDIVRRYDIDGIHFDDYFYPYPEAGLSFNDQASYQQYRRGFSDIKAWRRDNINLFIKALSDSIRQQKPWISFGISPFGVWRNQSQDPEGSLTRAGITTYDDLYADVRLWLREGWIDYVAPQLYWDTQFKAAPYTTVMPWWANNTYGRHYYVGHAAYRITSDTGGWKNINELLEQKELNRSTPTVNGSIFYSSTALVNNLRGVPEKLAKTYYYYPAFVPPFSWKSSPLPPPPTAIRSNRTSNGVLLQWTPPATIDIELEPRFYVIYRFSGSEAVNFTSTKHVIATISGKSTSFLDRNAPSSASVQYVVTSINRMRNESIGSRIMVTASAK